MKNGGKNKSAAFIILFSVAWEEASSFLDSFQHHSTTTTPHSWLVPSTVRNTGGVLCVRAKIPSSEPSDWTADQIRILLFSI